MREKKMDRKSRYTRMALQDSLIELMKEKPINKITIKQLCENADINRSTFYVHYSDQYDLLREIEDETLNWTKQAVSEIIKKSDKQEAMELLQMICQYFAENSRHLGVLMSEQGDIDFQKQLFTLIYQQCGINSASGKSENMENREMYFIFAVTGSVGVIQHWLKTGLVQPPSSIAEIIFSMASPINELT